MKEDLEDCPWCGNELTEKEKKERHCSYCGKFWNSENEIEPEDNEPRKYKSSPMTGKLRASQRVSPNGDKYLDI